MKKAFVNGIEGEATSKARGVCRFCASSMRGYAGPMQDNHWKHISKDACDPWFEPETKWHREWKLHLIIDKSHLQ